jgi:tRNA G10  N-methylase Trm11
MLSIFRSLPKMGWTGLIYRGPDSLALPHHNQDSKKDLAMSDTIAKFNVQLLSSLKAAQNRLEAFNARATLSGEHAEKEFRSQIAAIENSAQKAKASLETAREEMIKWVDDPFSIVNEWKAKFNVSRLEDRADRATRYAEAASQIAVASVEQAEKATIAAQLARADADSAKAAKAA